ncbi:MAG: 30S ribosomal protein S17 [Lentisphaerae bacterium]|nr:30S ribosomal protein S17 [Lentisphaerota bacterium]
MPTTRGKRKERTGIVISNAMAKTIVVKVAWRARHPIYGKEMRLANKFFVHDETNQAKVGDTVRIMETRPMSRRKRWRLLSVVKAVSAAPPAAQLTEKK